MPSRLIREGILTSERIDQLDNGAEVFYRRLMSKVDDHGLYDARPSILRASLYPLRVDRVREADCSRWIAACEKAGLIALYQLDEKPYLQMLDTRWPARSDPKYPLPPSVAGYTPKPATENSCKHLLSPVALDVVVVGDVVGDVVVDEVDKKRRAMRCKPIPVPIPEDFKISERVGLWAKEKGHTRLAERLDHFVSYAKGGGILKVDWDETFMNAIRGDWAHLAGQVNGHGVKPIAAPLVPDHVRAGYGSAEAAAKVKEPA